jgi:type VI secretion system protein ImpB
VAKKSGQKFIARNRAPRVQIEYDVEVYGSQKTIQLPFVMGVMADLSGKPAEPLPAVADRKFLEIDIDNFDQRLKAMKPRVAFAVPNTLTGEGNLQVDITFESMDDFSPAAIARKVEPLRKLLETRTQLSNLMTYMDGKTGAEDLIGKMLADPGLLSALGATRNPAASRASAPPPVAAEPPTNGPAVEAPVAAAEPVEEAAEIESTDSSGKEDEGTDDLDSLLDQLN